MRALLHENSDADDHRYPEQEASSESNDQTPVPTVVGDGSRFFYGSLDGSAAHDPPCSGEQDGVLQLGPRVVPGRSLFIRVSLEAGVVEDASPPRRNRMKLHGNARTCPHSRRLMALRVLEQGWTLAAAAEAPAPACVLLRSGLPAIGQRARTGSPIALRSRSGP